MIGVLYKVPPEVADFYEEHDLLGHLIREAGGDEDAAREGMDAWVELTTPLALRMMFAPTAKERAEAREELAAEMTRLFKRLGLPIPPWAKSKSKARRRH